MRSDTGARHGKPSLEQKAGKFGKACRRFHPRCYPRESLFFGTISLNHAIAALIRASSEIGGSSSLPSEQPSVVGFTL
jgi:hypothetical protein